MSDFRVIQGCPVHARFAPFLALLVEETNATVNSIYRGGDAAWLLHKHGRHTQAEIHVMYPGISNPPGCSTHELRSDGVAFVGPIGRRLPWWCQGFDVDDANVGPLIQAAQKHEWRLFRPYSRGVEYHHLCFAREPRPASARSRLKLIHIRATLPRT